MLLFFLFFVFKINYFFIRTRWNHYHSQSKNQILMTSTDVNRYKKTPTKVSCLFKIIGKAEPSHFIFSFQPRFEHATLVFDAARLKTTNFITISPSFNISRKRFKKTPTIVSCLFKIIGRSEPTHFIFSLQPSVWCRHFKQPGFCDENFSMNHIFVMTFKSW